VWKHEALGTFPSERGREQFAGHRQFPQSGGPVCSHFVSISGVAGQTLAHLAPSDTPAIQDRGFGSCG